MSSSKWSTENELSAVLWVLYNLSGIFFFTLLLCIYYGFDFMFLWYFLCANSESLHLYVFLGFFFGSFISVCLFYLILLWLFLILSYYFLKISVCVLLRQRKGIWNCVWGKVGWRSGRNWGRGNHNQIYFMKKIDFQLKNKKVLHFKENDIEIYQHLGSMFPFQWNSKMQEKKNRCFVDRIWDSGYKRSQIPGETKVCLETYKNTFKVFFNINCPHHWRLIYSIHPGLSLCWNAPWQKSVVPTKIEFLGTKSLCFPQTTPSASFTRL